MSIMKNTIARLRHIALAFGAAALLGFAPAAFADEIVALKNALYGAGYDITNVNPGMDPATRSELTRFQKDNGLQANGILDEATKNALGLIRIDMAAATTSASPAKTQTAAPEKSEPVEEEAVEKEEEEDDGGWSFF